MNTDREFTSEVSEMALTGADQANNALPQTRLDPPEHPRKRKRKSNKKKPLEPPEDEAIAEYLSTPKSIREFKSYGELAKHFNISRMTVYRRTKDPAILDRAEWLLRNHKRAGNMIARLNWGQIMAGQVKAAVAGDTKAAQFCKEQAWPEDDNHDPLLRLLDIGKD